MESGDVERRPGPDKLSNKLYSTYAQNALMRSGDIETEPGPVKFLSFKFITMFLISQIFTITLLLIAKVEKSEDEIPLKLKLSSNLKESINLITHILVLNNKKKWTKLKIRTRSAYLVILLLLAGDIQTQNACNLKVTIPLSRVKLAKESAKYCSKKIKKMEYLATTLNGSAPTQLANQTTNPVMTTQLSKQPTSLPHYQKNLKLL